MKKRIDYLDGLKGICALLVSMYHFFIAGYYKGFVGFGTSFSKAEALEQINNNFLSAFITNNAVGLYIFFVLIAVFPVISFRKKNSNPEVMGRYACKRYFQLFPLCFITSILMVIMLNGGFIHYTELGDLLNNHWVVTNNPDNANLLEAIKIMLLDAWFTCHCEVASLWCLYIIFRGSLMTYAVYALFGNSKFKYLPTIVLFILSFVTNYYYICFAFGTIIGELLASDKQPKTMPLMLSIIMMAIGIIVIKIPNNLYPFELDANINGAIGAFLIILSIIKCEQLKSFFSNKVLTFLGKISFELIISHMFAMGTLAYPFARLLLTKMELGFNYCLIWGAVCTLISIIPAYLLNKYISPLGGKLAKKVENICFGK